MICVLLCLCTFKHTCVCVSINLKKGEKNICIIVIAIWFVFQNNRTGGWHISRSSQECRSIPKGPEREQIHAFRCDTRQSSLSGIAQSCHMSSSREISEGNAMERTTRMVEFTFDQRADILCKENARGREIERCLPIEPLIWDKVVARRCKQTGWSLLCLRLCTQSTASLEHKLACISGRRPLAWAHPWRLIGKASKALRNSCMQSGAWY